jgi:hypothetical protein
MESMMIIYEVNLTVNNDIYNEYYNWLLAHIKTMLTFQGFHQAELAKEKSIDEDKKTKLTVRYTLKSEQDLNNYFNRHAQSMREDGTKRFGDKFSATRRVFIEPCLVKLP